MKYTVSSLDSLDPHQRRKYRENGQSYSFANLGTAVKKYYMMPSSDRWPTSD